MLVLLAQSAKELERLFEDWRVPLISLAVGGFIIGVLGHLFRTKTMVVIGIGFVFMAVVAFPIVLYLRGAP
ncbi:MAG: hypothetical protein QOG63_1003 [Thermoleophilaceae bacterium]|jgi:hypothetical protein|nr:hypothetical protein [Thermoleophilaceae bacterium]